LNTLNNNYAKFIVLTSTQLMGKSHSQISNHCTNRFKSLVQMSKLILSNLKSFKAKYQIFNENVT